MSSLYTKFYQARQRWKKALEAEYVAGLVLQEAETDYRIAEEELANHIERTTTPEELVS